MGKFIKQPKFWLGLILLLAFGLRFFQLGNIPVGFDWDEASNAYNGYSIYQTGQDEYGKSLPLLFRAFDGYVPGVLIYLNSLTVGLLGLNKLAARLPNAFLGVLAVYGLYLLVKELLEITPFQVVSSNKQTNQNNQLNKGKREQLALLSSLFLAIQPWHILYSRVNTLASTPLVFIIFGSYFLVKSIKVFDDKARNNLLFEARSRELNKTEFSLRSNGNQVCSRKSLIVSIISFVLAIFSYFSAYIFVPLFVGALVVIFRNRVNRGSMVGILVPVLFAAIFVMFILPGGQKRLKGVSAISDPDLIKQESVNAIEEGLIGKIIHNRRLVYTQKFLEGYFAPLRFDFLFSKADSVGRMIVPGAGFGLLYWFDFLLLPLGIYELWRQKILKDMGQVRPQTSRFGFQPLLKNNELKWVIFSWLILSPIPAAPTLPKPASTRLALAVPALAVVSALGLSYLWKYFSFTSEESWLRKFSLPLSEVDIKKIGLIGLIAINVAFFVHQYFVHYPVVRSADWFYAYEPLFSYLNQPENQAKQIYFVFKQPDYLDQVHIFTAFYNAIDPRVYQASDVKLGRIATTGEFSLNRFHFVPDECLECGKDVKPGDLVITSREIKEQQPVTVIKELTGEESLWVYRGGEGIVAGIKSFE